MSEDDLTRPERAAQIRQAKRYKRAIEKRGLCSACTHREVETVWGVKVWRCAGKKLPRTFPDCQNDGRQPKFEFDPTILEEFKDAA